MGKYAKDHGGDGGSFKMSRANLWVCNDCGAKQHVSAKALSRRTRTLCKQCGGSISPSEVAQEVNPLLRIEELEREKKRKCTICGAVLRSGNPNKVCSPCWSRGRGR